METAGASMSLRRRAVVVLLLGSPLGDVALAQGQRDASGEVLSLYGLTLKNARVDAFVAAARAAGGVPLPVPAGAPPLLDTRASGVPALEQLTVIGHEGLLVSARFKVKSYGQDNEALRRLLVEKYGVPMSVSARPLPAPGFASRGAPRGRYAWTFADGMQLVYDHPQTGDVTLSYTDDAKARALAAGAAASGGSAKSELRDRL
jgi:hypothetical protein